METNIIVNQDCFIGMKKLPNESVDLIVTSPPYDNLREYNNSSNWNYQIFQNIALEIIRVLKNGGVLVWIVGDMMIDRSESGSSFKQCLYFKEQGLLLHDTMIWQKISPFQHKNRYIQSFEYMFVLSKGVPKTANLIQDRKNKWVGTRVHGTERQKNGKTKQLSEFQKRKTIKEYGARYNIWDIPPNKNNKTGHPAVFPLEIAQDHILSWSNEGDTVLDPFLGSGTTAIAAFKLHRKYIGFEIDEKYFNIACERLDEIEGKGSYE